MFPIKACFFVIAVFSSLRVITALTPVDPCGNNSTATPEVVIDDCVKQPCDFIIGGVVLANMTFQAPKYLEHIAPRVIATAAGIDVPYLIPQFNACDGIMNTPCPLAENETVIYHLKMDVLSIFPEIGLNLKFSIIDLDNNDEEIMCFRVAAQTKHN